MKRFSFCDSSSSFIYPTEEENATERLVYSSEFQSMLDGLDEEDMAEENNNCATTKKRRLSVDQVHALEKVFEVDNKLDPERKLKIANELGLQPRQVAIWFQNRRARYKTKQLERDYNVLKANYDSLHHNFTKVEKENQTLIAELKGLKEKLGEENRGTQKQEQRNRGVLQLSSSSAETTKDLMEFKDNGSSDSDSSGVMNNEDCNFNFQPHLVRIEEQIGAGFINTTEEFCNIFSLDQPPNLYWYSADYYRNQ